LLSSAVDDPRNVIAGDGFAGSVQSWFEPRRLHHLATNKRGAAAAEMAIILPLLVTLMFGSFEVGKYFLDAHRVQQAVRDGARFAGRQGFVDMPCGWTATAR
jgi:hypothetical protein